MIAANKAHRIRRSLDIVAINDDVADGTNQIAAACGAKLFRELWKGQIAQKNSAAMQRLAQTRHINETLTCLRTPCKAGRH